MLLLNKGTSTPKNESAESHGCGRKNKEITSTCVIIIICYQNVCVCPGDVSQLKEEFVSLTDECQTLTSDNKELSSKVEQLQQQRDT